jgi:hypothetical protein
MMKILCSILLCVAGFTLPHAHQTNPSNEFFPFRPGTYWIYKGTVGWYDPATDKPVAAEVTWKMSVQRVIRKQQVVAAVISGFPADLDWTGGTTEPKPWLFVEDTEHRVYYETLGPDYDLSKLNGDEHVFDKFMVDDNLFFQWPLHDGAKFCGDEDAKKREDSMYCWVVARSGKRTLDSVKGAAEEEQQVFRMEFRTLPDDTTIELVPGIGVVTYEYHHHGTVADTQLHLVEFHPAPESASVQGPKP